MKLLITIIEFIKSIIPTVKYILSFQPMAWNFIKRNFLRKISQENWVDIFVETGTFYGWTTQYMSYFVKKIFTIEIYEPLFIKAKEKFKDYKSIEVFYGDSSEILENLVLNGKVLFFLDWHYSGSWTGKWAKECPLFEELEKIKNKNLYNPIVIIDDFRLFGIDKNYPTICQIEKYIKDINNNYTIQIVHDMVYCFVE